MKAFTLVQNFLTALVIPFLAIIVGLSSIPGIYVFSGIITTFTETSSINWLMDVNSLGEIAILGVALGMGITVWGICLLYTSPSPRD